MNGSKRSWKRKNDWHSKEFRYGLKKYGKRRSSIIIRRTPVNVDVPDGGYHRKSLYWDYYDPWW